MPIDFGEDLPKRKLASCQIHNLKYDPEVTWGCVLCKNGQKKRLSWILTVGTILILAAVAFSLFPLLFPQKSPSPIPQIHAATITASDTDGKMESGDCLLGISTQIEECFSIAGTDASNSIDREICLNPLQNLETTCAGSYSVDSGEKSALFSVGEQPDWNEIRTLMETIQGEIESCVDTSSYKFAMRFSVNGQSGAIMDVTGSTFGMSADSRPCLYKLFSDQTLPTTSKAENYYFTAFIDSAVLRRNRPEIKSPQQIAYEKFKDQKRQEIINEDNRASLQAQQKERENRYRESLKKDNP